MKDNALERLLNMVAREGTLDVFVVGDLRIAMGDPVDPRGVRFRTAQREHVEIHGCQIETITE